MELVRQTFTQDQYSGCLLGLALGDALGAPHEGGPVERGLWRLIGRTRDGSARWTDDTQMALDLAHSLLAQDGLCQDDLALRFARGYAWHRGYGPGTARLLKRIRAGQPWAQASRSVFPDGSYGNGAAMRAPMVALFFARDVARLVDGARRSAQVTHAHPLGVEGAVLIAVATHALLCRHGVAQVVAAVLAHCQAAQLRARITIAADWLADAAAPTPREVATRLGNGMTAETSCVTALYVGLRHLALPFEDMMAFVIACGGDVDTLGAMAGALWGAANGAQRLPRPALEQRALLDSVAVRLYQR